MCELNKMPDIFPPYNIIIDNKQYIYKGKYANGDYSYRCPDRSHCKIIIRIPSEELKNKYKNKNSKINYTIVSKERA